MKKQYSTKANRQALLMSFITCLVVLTYEACSPMKSNSLLDSKPTSTNICALTTKATSSILKAQKAKDILFIFSEKKVRLEIPIHSKASSLLNKTITVSINLNCKPANDSLSEYVLTQNKELSPQLSEYVFKYKVDSPLSTEDLTMWANNDPCTLGVTWPGTLKTSSLPLPTTNDTSLHHQTYLQKSNYAHAFEHIVQKSNGLKNVKIGFVDTGASCDHSDLKANLVNNCGFDAISGTSPEDSDGHGSHVIGLVGAVTNNNRGIMGLAGNTAQIHAIKVINLGTGTALDAANGIQHAIDQELDIINISLGSNNRVFEVEQKVQQAVAAGIFVVMAAGNDEKVLDPSVPELITSPAVIGKNLDGAITVGSVNLESGLLSRFSNSGDYVEIAAIGSFNNTLSHQSAGLLSTSKGGLYKKLMGTSQAAPMITGAVALLIQFFKQNQVDYTVAQLEHLIKISTDSNPEIAVGGHRVLNFSKLTRNAYDFAGIELCP